MCSTVVKLFLTKSTDLGKQVRMQFRKGGVKVEIGVRWLCGSWPFHCERGVFEMMNQLIKMEFLCRLSS